MSINSLPSERFAVVGTIDPDNYTSGTQTSDYVDMADFDSLMALVAIGEADATMSVNAKLVQATSAAGAGKKDVSGKAITELTGSDDDTQAIINLRAEELDVGNDFQFVALEVTLADSASPDANDVDVMAVIFGADARYLPASDNDLASVDEIVS